MRYTKSVLFAGILFLTVGAAGAQAQTMSGQGVNTSQAAGYGAQVVVKGMKSQVDANTSIIAGHTTALSDLTSRLSADETQIDNLDQRLSSVENRLDNLEALMQSIKTSITNINNQLSQPTYPECQGEGSYLQSDGKTLSCWSKPVPVWFDVGGTECNNAQCSSSGSPGTPTTAEYLCKTHGYTKHVDVVLYTHRTSGRVCTGSVDGRWSCDNSCSSCGPGIAKISCLK